MANTSISGLVSGLDTSTIISQLMQIEAQPQTNLKNQVTAQQKVVTSLQGVNARLAALATSAGALGKVSGWSAMTATSSNSNVTVTAGADALPANLTLTVHRLATATTLDLGTHALPDKVMSDGSTLVSFSGPDGVAHDVDTKDGTVQGLVNAINSGGYGASATLVQVTAANPITGTAASYRVQIASALTGDKSLTLAAPSGSAAGLAVATAPTPGQQAWITVGSDDIYSDSNSYTGLMPGVDVTLGAGATGSATITVGHDAKSLSDSVKAMVDSVNAILSDIDTATAYDSSSKSGGPLSGDPTVRDLRNKLLSVVSNGITTSTGSRLSMSSVGIQTDRDGKLVFDAAKFATAYAADPAGTQAMFAGGSVTDPATKQPATITAGFASAVESVANGASNSTTGSVTTAIQGRNSSIKNMNDAIADWDVRLADRQAALQKQYAALEVALGKLQDQSTWLAGQIGSLPSPSKSS